MDRKGSVKDVGRPGAQGDPESGTRAGVDASGQATRGRQGRKAAYPCKLRAVPKPEMGEALVGIEGDFHANDDSHLMADRGDQACGFPGRGA